MMAGVARGCGPAMWCDGFGTACLCRTSFGLASPFLPMKMFLTLFRQQCRSLSADPHGQLQSKSSAIAPNQAEASLMSKSMR